MGWEGSGRGGGGGGGGVVKEDGRVRGLRVRRGLPEACTALSRSLRAKKVARAGVRRANEGCVQARARARARAPCTHSGAGAAAAYDVSKYEHAAAKSRCALDSLAASK